MGKLFQLVAIVLVHLTFYSLAHAHPGHDGHELVWDVQANSTAGAIFIGALAASLLCWYIKTNYFCESIRRSLA
jgi:hypothetical protein